MNRKRGRPPKPRMSFVFRGMTVLLYPIYIGDHRKTGHRRVRSYTLPERKCPPWWSQNECRALAQERGCKACFIEDPDFVEGSTDGDEEDGERRPEEES